MNCYEIAQSTGPITLTAEEREDYIEWASSFEECVYSKDELRAMNDERLRDAGYWAMRNYAMGQL